MDTYKESLDLTDLCRPGPPPWLSSSWGSDEGELQVPAG
jgi:hypothetical protein